MSSLLSKHATKHHILVGVVYSLKSHSRSVRADIPGLALIMVDAVSVKLKGILHKLDTLLEQSPRDKSLQYCSHKYHLVLSNDISVAKDAITLGNPKFAEESMNYASQYADSCEREFKGRSPLTKQNEDIGDLSRVTSTIVKILE